MSKISSLPDFSRYVRTVDKVHLNNTVKLVIGEVVIEVNGYIISLKSSVLEDLVCTQSEIFLDGFEGEEESVQQCVELLYGGTVELNEKNVKVIVKFGAIYKVEELIDICLEWLKSHVSADNLLSLIELGFLIQTVGHDNQKVLDLCRDFIAETVKDDVEKVSEEWVINVNFIKFLLQDEILYYTLSIVEAWVSGDPGVTLVLDEVERKGLNLSGERGSRLVEKMSQRMESLETSRRIIRLQSAFTDVAGPSGRAGSGGPSRSNLTALLKEKWIQFSVEKIMAVEQEYGLQHFEYVDIIFQWLDFELYPQQYLTMLLETLRPAELSYDYFKNVKMYLSGGRYSRFTFPASIDQIYKFQHYESVLMQTERKTRSGIELLLGGKVSSFKLICEKCGTAAPVTFRFVKDKCPCYELISTNSHLDIKYLYVAIPRLSYIQNVSCHISSFDRVAENLRKSAAVSSGYNMGLVCAYKCQAQSSTSASKKRKI